MEWWDGFWTWYAREFQEDPAGWISLFILAGGVIIASIWGRKIIAALRSVPGRIDRWLRRHYAPAEPTVPSVLATLSVSFVIANETGKSYLDTVGRRQGGVINYSVKNNGPMDVADVWISLESPQLDARSGLFWEQLSVGSAAMFTVLIPFGADRAAIVLWKQDGVQCNRRIVLPMAKD